MQGRIQGIKRGKEEKAEEKFKIRSLIICAIRQIQLGE
jgi:hypothetical protein